MDTQAIQLPPAIAGKSLVGIFKINRERTFDEIYLKTGIKLGYITTNEDNQFIFNPIDSDTPDTPRESYEAVWFDILVMIANDQDLAIEFAVLAQRATINKPKKATIVESLKGF